MENQRAIISVRPSPDAYHYPAVINLTRMREITEELADLFSLAVSA